MARLINKISGLIKFSYSFLRTAASNRKRKFILSFTLSNEFLFRVSSYQRNRILKTNRALSGERVHPNSPSQKARTQMNSVTVSHIFATLFTWFAEQINVYSSLRIGRVNT
jgi:hypothetical protein